MDNRSEKRKAVVRQTRLEVNLMNEQIPKKKQTVLGLYATSAEAYDKWQATPDKVKLLDVRTPEEFIFVGHPEMAQCIPLGFQSYRWDEKKRLLRPGR
jgi:hypothetical protein